MVVAGGVVKSIGVDFGVAARLLRFVTVPSKFELDCFQTTFYDQFQKQLPQAS
jgi:hypothetical protein